MSTNAIEFVNVSKKFRKGEKFDSLRDFIPNLVKGTFRKNGKNGSLKDQEFWAVKDVSFQLKKGEALGIIGPNGAGKSTILKMLSRIYNPTSGEIKINGKLSALLEVGAGFHPDLTGRENIYLSGAIIGMKKKEIEKKIDSIIEFSELEDFIDTPVKRYSSGMYVRLGFSISAYMDPDILLLDEVLAVGDAAFQAKCLGQMRDVVAEGRTILFVSHDMGAMRKICKRVVVLNKGNVIFDGDVDVGVQKYHESLIKKSEKIAIEGSLIKNFNVEVNGKSIEHHLYALSDNPIDLSITIEFNEVMPCPRIDVAFFKTDGTKLFGIQSDRLIVYQSMSYGNLWKAHLKIKDLKLSSQIVYFDIGIRKGIEQEYAHIWHSVAEITIIGQRNSSLITKDSIIAPVIDMNMLNIS